jgi:hypothetical protein
LAIADLTDLRAPAECQRKIGSTALSEPFETESLKYGILGGKSRNPLHFIATDGGSFRLSHRKYGVLWAERVLANQWAEEMAL